MKFGEFITKILPHFTSIFIFGAPLFIDVFLGNTSLISEEFSIRSKLVLYILIYVFVLVLLIATALHIPKGKKDKFNVCLIIVTNNINDDAQIVKHNIVTRFEAFAQNNEDLFVTVPNILCRYFFNYWCFNNPFLNNKGNLALRILTKLSRADLVIFGQIEPIMDSGTQCKEIHINTFLPVYKKNVDAYLKNINTLLNKTELFYDINYEREGLIQISNYIIFVTKLFLSLYYNEINKTQDGIRLILSDINSNIAKLVSKGEVSLKNAYKQVMKYYLVEISYSSTINDETIDLIVNACKNYINTFGEDTDILLTQQFFAVNKLRRNHCSFEEYRDSIQQMLHCLNNMSFVDENYLSILANKAYLNLLNHNYPEAINLYDELLATSNSISRNVFIEIFKYYRDIEPNSYEYEYAQFAYAYYNLKANKSPEAHNIARRVFEHLVSNATDEFIFTTSNDLLKNISSDLDLE